MTFVSRRPVAGPPLGNQCRRFINAAEDGTVNKCPQTSSKTVHWNPPSVNAIELA
jgi:hypothetical protein